MHICGHIPSMKQRHQTPHSVFCTGIRLFMYACVCVCVCVCVCTYMYTGTQTHTHEDTCVQICTYICPCTVFHVWIFMFMCVYPPTHTHAYIHKHTHTQNPGATRRMRIGAAGYAFRYVLLACLPYMIALLACRVCIICLPQMYA